ncbi:hypothetical protein AYO40_03480 [Planctomycetaceae bacterium SCGC AG-212-D15]|nr:hypothetical protein AYO40_03480 [Planctomycetaceae bacterium SCGC AG-212-D15]
MRRKVERNADVIAMRKDGKTITEIAAAFHLSRQRIFQILSANNFSGRITRRVMSDDREAVAREMLGTGALISEVAEAIGVSVSVIVRWKSALGVKSNRVARHVGKRRNMLTIDNVVGNMAYCTCECGGKHVGILNNVLRGLTKSCGCLRIDYWLRRGRYKRKMQLT